MLENFDFSGLKKIGVYSKDIKRNDYEAQAARICQFFGYKTVYEYGSNEIHCHLSMGEERPLHVDKNGELQTEPFVTIIKSLYE